MFERLTKTESLHKLPKASTAMVDRESIDITLISLHSRLSCKSDSLLGGLVIPSLSRRAVPQFVSLWLTDYVFKLVNLKVCKIKL